MIRSELYNHLHHQFPTYKYLKCQAILERFPTLGGSHHLSSTIYQLEPWFQKVTWSKGFILDPLHHVRDIHHQQGIHWRSRRWKAGASDRLDTIQDLGSPNQGKARIPWNIMIQMILNRYFEKVISAWGPHDLPWSLLVYNNVRIWKKKTKSSGSDSWDGLGWNRWWAAFNFVGHGVFWMPLHPDHPNKSWHHWRSWVWGIKCQS